MDSVVFFVKTMLMLSAAVTSYYYIQYIRVDMTNKTKRKRNYRIVSELPAGALSVAKYAKKRGCTTNYIYVLLARERADFEVVVFSGYNFVIPLT